jgi:cell division protein FtsL
MTNATPRLYRLLRASADRAPKAHRGVVLLVIVFCSITALAVNRVNKRHDVMRVGYQLSKESQRLSQLREANRRLTVELAMLSAPERIRMLATQLGMLPVPPDQIRLVTVAKSAAVNASLPSPLSLAARDRDANLVTTHSETP